MNAKQLELFTESDFETQKTYFRKVNSEWIIVDNFNNFGRGRKTHYKLVVQIRKGDIYNENSTQTAPLGCDEKGEKISVSDYFVLTNIIKKHGKYVFNKKLGKLISKKG